MTQYGKVCLRRGEDARICAGADWIYDNELDWADDICRTGDVVDVLDSRMRFVARVFRRRSSSGGGWGLIIASAPCSVSRTGCRG